MAREARLVQTMVELADNLVDDFDLGELFHVVVHRCVDLLDVSTAGLMLVDAEGSLQLVASSSDAMRVVELLELETQEGPCVDCYRDGRPVVNQDLTADNTPWPRFTKEALAGGFMAVHALPMRLRGQVIGALNLFHHGTGRMDDADIVAAKALADIATIAVLQHRVVVEATRLSDNLASALQSRVVIEQAKGIIAAHLDLSMRAAFEALRQYSRSNNLRIADVSQRIVGGTMSMATLTGPTTW